MPQTETQITGVNWRDYLELCKPNVVALMILTSLIGIIANHNGFPLSPILSVNPCCCCYRLLLQVMEVDVAVVKEEKERMQDV